MKSKKISNPPDINIHEKFNSCSSTECTGLITVPPENEDELENYKDVYEFEATIL